MKLLLYVDNQDQKNLISPFQKAFYKLGHEVQLFEQMEEMYKVSKLFKLIIFQKLALWFLREKNRWGYLKKIFIYIFFFLLKRAKKTLNEGFISILDIYQPDIIIVFKGLGITPTTLRYIKSNHTCLIVNYNGDDPHNLYSSNQDVLEAISLYDCVYIWSRKLIPTLYNDGAKYVEYLPFAFDSDFDVDLILTKEDHIKYSSDIVFIGTWDKEREKILENLAGFDLGIWGPHWNEVKTNKLLASKVKGGKVDMKTMLKIYKSSKIILNLMRPQNSTSHNMKTFEIPSLGGFMIAPMTKEHAELFDVNKEIAFYSDLPDLRDKIRYYLKNEGIRRAMIIKAQQRVYKDHSYLVRASQILKIGERDL